MPHKHRRDRSGKDQNSFNLPPSKNHARPLPTSNPIVSISAVDIRKKSKKRKRAEKDDDTPRAFQRLMAFQARGHGLKSLDDGIKNPKPRRKQGVYISSRTAKPSTSTETPAQNETTQTRKPTIRPGEKLSEFGARVDRSLPISALQVRGNKDPLGLHGKRTKTEKRMHKMYAEWREDEARRKERLEEAAEQAEEDEEEAVANGTALLTASSGRKRGKGTKRKRRVGEIDDGGDEDPWEAVKLARKEGKIGLHDVAQAPPILNPLKERFKVKMGGAAVEVGSIPRASGSLRKREELETTRASVIASYRKLMEQKRTGQEV